MEILKEAPMYPWLIIQDTIEYNMLLYCDISGNRYYKKSISFLENKRICYCSQGWFILKDVELNDYCLFHPITSEIITLPPLPKDVTLDINLHLLSTYPNCHLYLSPTNPNCRVIFFNKNSNTLFFCKPKDEKFMQQKQKGFEGFTMLGEKGYCCILDNQGSYYAAISFEGSQIHINRLPENSDFRRFYYGCYCLREYLVEICSELVLVCPLNLCGREIYDVMLYKWESEKKKWMEIENIGSSTIFISTFKGAVACSTQDLEVEKNSIYFSNPIERFYRIFNIEDHSFSKTLPCSIAAQGSICHWVMTNGSHPI